MAALRYVVVFDLLVASFDIVFDCFVGLLVEVRERVCYCV